ncbi:uncharacterized protein LOC121403794 [Drosophila obscura]|uniref:uncharacterized protein LOC121403794 n=1 Tax=Drosophila obscura TaxID=7282 RepID=UPI001BB16AB1|nr:uncharacterized protein LOC121403794 [Drosophila obscura]
MGNDIFTASPSARLYSGQCADIDAKPEDTLKQSESPRHSCDAREVSFLREEVKVLRSQLKDLDARHYEAMESADSVWAEQEQERKDSHAAAGLKTCLVRLTKEVHDLLEAQEQLEVEQQMPVALENEKRRCQALIDELSFAKKLQASTEEALKQEAEALRSQMYDLRKSFMHNEVTNGELKEEVGTLENKIRQMESQLKESEERARCLEDELRTKDKLCQRMEREIGVFPEGFSLAHELYDSPAKRAKREEIKDLQSASLQLGCVLRDIERQSVANIPPHKDFQLIACRVKQLADQILAAKNPPEVSTMFSCPSNETLTAAEEAVVEGDLRGVGGAAVGQVSSHGSAKTLPALRRYRRLHAAANPSKTKDRSEQISEALDSPNGLLLVGTELLGEPPVSMETLCEFPAPAFNEVPGLTMESFFVADDMEQPEMEHIQQLDSRQRKRTMPKCTDICSRIYRGRVRRRALQRSLSSNSFYSMASLHTVHSDTSMLSFRSQHASLEAAPTATADYVSFVQTESISTCVQAVQTELETSECYTQCDRVDVEQRLLLLPDRTRRFVELLQCEAEDVQRFRASLLQMWESSESFREHIELVQDLYWAQLPPPVESLEVFASAMGAVRDLAATMQPKSSFTLKKIEQRFNDRVLHLHCEMAKKTEPENPVKAMQQMGLVFTHVARPNPLFELLGIACNPNKESANI